MMPSSEDSLSASDPLNIRPSLLGAVGFVLSINNSKVTRSQVFDTTTSGLETITRAFPYVMRWRHSRI